MKKFITAFFIALGFLVFGVLTISDYGINWDAPLHMLRGQAYAHFFLTRKTTYGYPNRISPMLIKPDEYASRYYYLAAEIQTRPVVLPKIPLLRSQFEQVEKTLGRRLSFYEHESWNGEFFLKHDDGHPPLVDILAAFSNKLFYQRLNVLGDIESYQFMYLLISSLGIFIVCFFTYDITNSLLAEAVAGLSLALFPIFINASHINMKDPEQAVFFIGSIWSFWHWVKDNKLKWFITFLVFCALAFATKWNIITLPLVVIPWLFLIRKSNYFKRWFKIKRLVFMGFIGLMGIFGFLVLIWPWLWSNTIPRLLSVVNYYRTIGLSDIPIQPGSFILPFGFNLYPPLLYLTKTPLIILFLALIAVLSSFFWGRREVLKTPLLLFFLVALPILRFFLPHFWFIGGIREFMEVVPATAVLAGIGAFYLFKIRQKLIYGIVRAAVLISFSILFLIIIRYNPNEYAVFNSLAGGLKGAVQKNLVDWTLSYGSIYKQGIKWLNQHAEKNARIALTNGPQYAISPLWLRSDISISPYHFSGLAKEGEYIILLYNPPGLSVFAARYPKRFLNPVYSVYVDGVPLLTIYKNSPEFVKNGYKEEEVTTNFSKQYIANNPIFNSDDIWEITLDKERKVTRIEINNAPPYCLNNQVEYVGFLTDYDLISQVKRENTYYSQEGHYLDDGKIEYFYAGEPARYIFLFPRGNISCFSQGHVTAISYLK